MVGDTEEPFTLSFQAISIHSGSISFGRFETECLSWERRSSFSRNTYLDEVEKCSKPGSVSLKKAYFEAHFKKKGIPSPTSLEAQTWTVHPTHSDFVAESNDSYDYDQNCEESNKEEFGCPDMPPEIEVNDIDNTDRQLCAYESVEKTSSEFIRDVPGKPHHATKGSLSGPGLKSREKVRRFMNPSPPESTKASSIKRRNTPEKASPGSAKGSLSCNAKTHIDNKSQKECRPKRSVKTVEQKSQSRTPPASNRFKAGVFSGKQQMGTGTVASQRAGKRNEAKEAEKKRMEAKTQGKVRKNLNFKATPMPSFYKTGDRANNKSPEGAAARARQKATTGRVNGACGQRQAV